MATSTEEIQAGPGSGVAADWSGRCRERLRAVLDLGIDEGALSSKQMRRVRTISGATLAMILVAVLVAVQSLAVGRGEVVAYLAVATAAGVGNLALLRRSRDPQRAGHVAVGTLAVLISTSAVTAGGFYEPSFSWLYILPLAAAVALDVRGAAIWIGITLAITCGFWALAELGVQLRDSTSPEARSINTLIARVLTVSSLGAIGVGFVIAQRKTDQELERETAYLSLVMHAAVTANEAPSFAEALRAAVARICSSMGWVAGHVLRVAEDGSVRSTGRGYYRAGGPGLPPDLERASVERVFTPGEGLPGQAAALGRPQIATSASWAVDPAAEAPLGRGAAARVLGIETVIAVPVFVHGQVRAVLELGADRAIEDRERLLEVFTHIGRQLGRVAERTELQDRLRQTQKMEAVGQLAAGLAHEINNPMSFVRANLHALRESSLRGEGAKDEAGGVDQEELIAESLEGVERTIELVRDVLDFSRFGGAGPEFFEPADVNELIGDSIRIAGTDLGDAISFELDTVDMPPLSCSPGGLRQVFVNLMVNAIQAQNGGGRVRVATHSTPDRVAVRVEDDGPGIDAQHLERIFDPFFTTKPIGEGTGLGLTVSYEIVQVHGGEIRVDSRPGRGSTFEVRLPRRPRAAQA